MWSVSSPKRMYMIGSYKTRMLNMKTGKVHAQPSPQHFITYLHVFPSNLWSFSKTLQYSTNVLQPGGHRALSQRPRGAPVTREIETNKGMASRATVALDGGALFPVHVRVEAVNVDHSGELALRAVVGQPSALRRVQERRLCRYRVSSLAAFRFHVSPFLQKPRPAKSLPNNAHHARAPN